jgi:L-threonine-O-3-phosphate decarboxylase
MTPSFGPRREVLATPPAVHGGPDAAELRRLGLDPVTVLDFSVNVNPYGPSPWVHDAVARAALDHYPDPEATTLRGALAETLGVRAGQVLVGNGASELIWLTSLAFVRPGERAFVLGPTFSEYARAAALMGAAVTTWQAREEDEFVIRPEEVSKELDRLRPRLLFMCNPNNPTGTVLPPHVIGDWATRYPETLLVVDESYQAFAPELFSALPTASRNILVLRSMTKDYALAGLRLGFAVGDERVIGWLARVRPPWSVSGPSQAAGLAALGDRAHLADSLRALAEARTDLLAGLAERGLCVLPSAVHFFLVRVGDGAAFRRTLLRRGVLVRDGASFGLPAHVRIATRRPEDNARLLTALDERGKP